VGVGKCSATPSESILPQLKECLSHMSLHGDNNNEATPLLAENRHEADLPHALDTDALERGIWTLLWQHFSK